jgi:hypothetical protein
MEELSEQRRLNFFNTVSKEQFGIEYIYLEFPDVGFSFALGCTSSYAFVALERKGDRAFELACVSLRDLIETFKTPHQCAVEGIPFHSPWRKNPNVIRSLITGCCFDQFVCAITQELIILTNVDWIAIMIYKVEDGIKRVHTCHMNNHYLVVFYDSETTKNNLIIFDRFRQPTGPVYFKKGFSSRPWKSCHITDDDLFLFNDHDDMKGFFLFEFVAENGGSFRPFQSPKPFEFDTLSTHSLLGVIRSFNENRCIVVANNNLDAVVWIDHQTAHQLPKTESYLIDVEWMPEWNILITHDQYNNLHFYNLSGSRPIPLDDGSVICSPFAPDIFFDVIGHFKREALNRPLRPLERQFPETHFYYKSLAIISSGQFVLLLPDGTLVLFTSHLEQQGGDESYLPPIPALFCASSEQLAVSPFPFV